MTATAIAGQGRPAKPERSSVIRRLLLASFLMLFIEQQKLQTNVKTQKSPLVNFISLK